KMVNTPIPSNLKSEAKKAAKILREFTIPNTKVGPDKIIPAGLVTNAKGLAILSVAKLGFLITARAGSGIVIAKLDDGKTWSAPTAIGIAGLGGGFEIGAEVTDFVIILNKQEAVDAFSKGGNLTLGGNFTIAAGPIGRNLEADVALRSPAAIYTYSRTKGLFAGISIEGSALIERKETNRKFYQDATIRSYDILSGKVDPPNTCEELYKVLDEHDSMFKKAALAYAKREAMKEGQKQYDKRGGITGIVKGIGRRGSTKSEKSSYNDEKSSYDDDKYSYNDEKYNADSSDDESYKQGATGYSMAASTSDYSMSSKYSRSNDSQSKPSYNSSYDISDSQKRKEAFGGAKPKTGSSIPRSQSMSIPVKPKHSPVKKREAAKDRFSGSNAKVHKVRAIWSYVGQLPCDLTFKPGDEILVLTDTGRQNDWWEGTLNGHTGIFPANYCKKIYT
ncbi:unnamed protein product, partial [Owenia fusiformis]